MPGRGPLPKTDGTRRRRNPIPGFTQIAADARAGKPTPDWPIIAGDPTLRELAFWVQLWNLPQAEEWERLACEHLVAQYVRVTIAASDDPASTKLSSESRLIDATLGISPKAMLALRWQIADPFVDTQQSSEPAERPVFK